MQIFLPGVTQSKASSTIMWSLPDSWPREWHLLGWDQSSAICLMLLCFLVPPWQSLVSLSAPVFSVSCSAPVIQKGLWDAPEDFKWAIHRPRTQTSEEDKGSGWSWLWEPHIDTWWQWGSKAQARSQWDQTCPAPSWGKPTPVAYLPDCDGHMWILSCPSHMCGVCRVCA
jgi:hypothetical protein